jgi:fused signal recognition particle receptor
MLHRLKQTLQRSHKALTTQLGNLFLGKKEIDAGLLEELETILITADLGIQPVQKIMKILTEQVSRKELKNADALYQSLENILVGFLTPYQKKFTVNESHQPFVILFIGINGAGKTTTIGKLAKKLQCENKKVMLAAGDTFRAAAVHQLQIWGERNDIPVIAQQHKGADSAAVIHDAINSAKAKNCDVLLADTAGRLHTQQHLVEELKKVKRVISKLDDSAPHETLLVLDASIGQNSIIQAKQFHEAMGVTGIVITKLDGTAKGGIVFAITQELKLPIYFIGTGESITDIEDFDARNFVKALLMSE